MLQKQNRTETVLDPLQKALEQLGSGEVNALGYLYDRFADELFDLGTKYVKDGSWIEDQIHDLFLDLYRARHNMAKIRNIEAYLVTSLKRRLYKKNKARELLVDEGNFRHLLQHSEDHIDSSTETQWIDRERIESLGLGLKSAIGSLTNHQQSALHLRFVENKSYNEIAEHMDVSAASARTLLYRSIKILKEKVQMLLF